MFYFVLLMIGLTNLAVGYAVALHFGFGPKHEGPLEAQMRKVAAALPSFAIMGGDKDETPLDQLAPARPIENEMREDGHQNLPPSQGESDNLDSAGPKDENLPDEVRDFAALGAVAPAVAASVEADQPNVPAV